MFMKIAWPAAAILSVPSLLVLASPVLEDSFRRFYRDPLMSWYVASAVVALFLASGSFFVTPSQPDADRAPQKWLAVPAVFAGLYLATAAFQFSEDNTGTAWMYAAIGGVVGIGALAVRKQEYALAKWVLAICGLVSPPHGLFLVLVSREVAAMTLAPMEELGADGGSLGLR